MMSFEHCVRCTLCVENCPVFKVNPAFPGPKQSGPDAQRFRLDGEKSVDEWVKLCCQCKRCEVACPYGVNVSEIILKAQVKYSSEHFSPFAAHLFANTHELGRLGSIAAPITNFLTSASFVQGTMRLLGLSTHLPMPEYRFLSLARGRRKKGRFKSPRKVVFFHGCYLNYNRPDIGRGIRDLLAYLGCRVAMPPQTCCGLPALGNGDIDMARRYAQKNAQRLVEYIDKGYSVLYACTSCGLTLVHDYPEVFEIPEGRKIAENTYNLHEFILEAIEDGSISMDFGEVNRRIAYHIPCHLRALGIGYPAARLFEKIPGLTFEILEDDCCGLAGSYGFKKKNQQTSVNLGVIAAAAITSLPVDAFASDCGACKMQLGHFTGLPAFDPSEIVIESLANRSKKKAVRKRRMP
ncbi:MAG TPA: anaerobic glycerol-3-phosphate dehydrogenase subunit C [Deltaproteobacteria bacterium]|jgi:glycerol-3-phosphate dehydrogenase subunit C|nr:anaerobic glycerol-3-phosphate dehydrogenase subunit C [Deltaproteobacteria bacterium]HQI01735.1 anaerobic glycerol-3-phosphate dehydrogenase subunit C [Deltaproteobacteria bacterium]HQJ07932.1 anaerobic glycerol-3-phosphate dehydrogenase subunit C [Deltaproteobacteria bacterium]